MHLLFEKADQLSHTAIAAAIEVHRDNLNVPLGLLINFNVTKLTDGISRMMLPKSNL